MTLAIVLAAADQARSADGCEYGQAATVTGQLGDIYEFGKEKKQWSLVFADSEDITCEVENIYTGDTPRPAGCVTGATATATGILEESDGQGVSLGSLTALVCTP